MQSILQGLLLGIIMILPGMSGGTAFVIMGIYERLVTDLGKLRIVPYIPLFGGIIVGMFAGGMVFAVVFEAYRNVTAALLLGCVLASIRSVLNTCPRPNRYRVAFLIMGLIAGLALAAEPIAVVSDGTFTPPHILIIGGALSTAAMVIPGVPGSSVLIAMGIYDSLLLYLKELAIMQLLYYGIGAVLGLFLLVKALERLYANYRGILAFFFSGLIAGSARALLPYSLSIPVVIAFAIGFAGVWYWSGLRSGDAPEDPGKEMSPCALSSSSD